MITGYTGTVAPPAINVKTVVVDVAPQYDDYMVEGCGTLKTDGRETGCKRFFPVYSFFSLYCCEMLFKEWGDEEK
ncbi:MAG: hypothetical protein QW517_09465 [Thermofilaceae archaeon]